MRNIIKNLGSIMLLICLSLILLTGCSRKSQLKLAIEMANKQCPMSIGTTGEISSITFDGTDVIYSLLMNEDYLDLDALGKNTDAMKSAAAQFSPAVDFADLDGNLLIANDRFKGMEVVKGKITLPDLPGIGVVKL